jgi:integrase
VTRPAGCERCTVRPRAYRKSRFCHACMPGGPQAPPPCRRCGTDGDYYASGLCHGCHGSAPPRPGACLDCHAWGVTKATRWLCAPCVTWRYDHDLGDCRACRRTVTIGTTSRVCRLCRVKARQLRPAKGKLNLTDVNGHGVQLFLANMHKAATWTRRGKLIPAAPVGWPAGRPVAHKQLVLIDVAWDLTRGRAGVPPPKDPELAAALHQIALDHAADHGWTRQDGDKARAGIRLLLGMQDTPGARIRTSDTAVLSQTYVTIRPVLDILATVGMLDDDRIPPIRAWFDQQAVTLPPAMAAELRTWFDIMLDGSTTTPRRRPRTAITTRIYLTYLLPALRVWVNAGHTSLREITTDDVVAVLPAPGTSRSLFGQSARSLFAILKARKLVFVNPTNRIDTPHPAVNPPMPIELAALRAALDSHNPARALVAALAAYHALRSGDLRGLQLDDIRDRHLRIGRGPREHVVLLAPPVRQRLNTYLQHRTARWPDSPNPHLFIHVRTAARTDAVGRRWVGLTLDIPGNIDAIRQDRILHEAYATGGDTRRLCDLFGLSINAASRYTNTVREPAIGDDRHTRAAPTIRGS